jgi:hypothetical protein
LAGLGAKVLVRHGELVVRVLGPIPALLRGFILHPDDPEDPYVFRIDRTPFGVGSARVVFSAEGTGPRTGVHIDLVPLRLEKQPAIRNPRLWITGAAWAVAGVTAAVAVQPRRAAKNRRRTL